MNKPTLLHGSKHKDERGELNYNNNFDISPVKRMYIIKHPDKSVVRAWQVIKKSINIFNA